MWSNRELDQKQKHKNQPWSNVECFAFGGATVRFRHWKRVSMPPPTQSLRHVRSTGIAKRLFFMFFVSVPQYLSTERFSEDSNRFVKGDKTRHIQMCINKKRLARFEHC